jgi:hypothetical protein
MKIAIGYTLEDAILIDENEKEYKNIQIKDNQNSILEVIRVYKNDNNEYDADKAISGMGIVFGISAWVNLD